MAAPKPSSFDYDLSDMDERPTRHNSDKLNYRYVTTPAQLEECKRALWGVKRIGLDIETTGYVPDADGNYPDKVTPADGHVRLIQIGVEDPEPRQWVIDCFAIDPTPVLDQAWKTARRPYVKFDQETVIHYAWFEQEWLGYHYGVHLGKIFDTCAISRKVNSKLPPEEKLANAKLMTVALSYLGVEMDKGPQSSDWSVEELSEEQILYAALDAAVLLDLVPPMKKRIVTLGLESECNSQMQKFWNVSNYLGRKYSQISKGELDSLEMQLHGSADFETSSQLAREIGRSRLHHADRVKAGKVILAKQDEHLKAGRHTNYDPRLVEDDDYPF